MTKQLIIKVINLAKVFKTLAKYVTITFLFLWL